MLHLGGPGFQPPTELSCDKRSTDRQMCVQLRKIALFSRYQMHFSEDAWDLSALKNKCFVDFASLEFILSNFCLVVSYNVGHLFEDLKI